MWKDRTLWFVIASSLLFGSTFGILPVSFPVFRQAFAPSPALLGATQSVYFACGMLFSVVAGWLI